MLRGSGRDRRGWLGEGVVGWTCGEHVLRYENEGLWLGMTGR